MNDECLVCFSVMYKDLSSKVPFHFENDEQSVWYCPSKTVKWPFRQNCEV